MRRDGVAGIKRRRRDLSGDDVRNLLDNKKLGALCNKKETALVVQGGCVVNKQRTLDINGSGLGLDHPDIIESYEDLLVFYYLPQHIELSLKFILK
ncbi:hypothetical protein Tco_1073800 [Tanacetum coccineum]